MATTGTGGRSGYGSGLYRRGNIFWVRVRSPARLTTNPGLRRFWRFSTGCTSSTEALRIARALRAALDRGFGVVGVWAMERALSRIEAEAVIGRLARHALAEAEALRALPCRRSEHDISTAKAAHAQAGAAWREALRHNDLAALAPMVVGVAGDLGLATPEAVATPALLREAARTLVAVAEENIAREDGIYAGDLALLYGRIGEGRASAPALGHAAAAMSPIAAQVPLSREAIGVASSNATAAVSEPPRTTPAPPVTACSTPLAAARACDASRDGAADVAVRPSESTGSVGLAPVDAERSNPSAAPEAPGASSSLKRALSGREMAQGSSEDPRRVATARPGPASRPAASTAATPRGRRAKPASKLARRGVIDPHVEMLRRLQGEQFWDITIADAFALERHRASQGGNNSKWLAGSARGFDKAAELAASYFEDKKLREISTVDCEDWRDLVIDLPNSHGKAKEYSGPLKDVVAYVNDKEDELLTELERRVEQEGWSVDRMKEAETETRIQRLAPATCYKHQSYLSQVFNNIIDLSGVGRNPMKKAMWSKAYKKQLIAEAGVKRHAWGEQDRRRLFGSALHCSGPDGAADAFFWAPLMTFYMGGRMEEVCQLQPGDVTCEDGVPVFDIKAGPGQKLKSLHSKRKIPIHPELIRIGIVKLAAQRKSIGARTLFDVERALDGSFSTRFSKLFHKWRHENGVYMPGKDAHSLRKDFYQSLKSGGVDYAARIVLMGHALNDVSETNYGHREWKIRQLRDFIATIPSDTAHIRPVV